MKKLPPIVKRNISLLYIIFSLLFLVAIFKLNNIYINRQFDEAETKELNMINFAMEFNSKNRPNFDSKINYGSETFASRISLILQQKSNFNFISASVRDENVVYTLSMPNTSESDMKNNKTDIIEQATLVQTLIYEEWDNINETRDIILLIVNENDLEVVIYCID